jgi:magnesium-transporting ATPase (P-type)
MITQANVGIGIEGKEGLQAAMSADFSVLKFKYVKDLLFWHGRNATLSTAYVTLFIIHRGLIVSLIQYFFSLFFYFVPVPFYNAILIIAYAVVYLLVPVVVLVRSAVNPLVHSRRHHQIPRAQLSQAVHSLPELQAPVGYFFPGYLLEESLPGSHHLPTHHALLR